ncbi:hypothetical protein ACFLY9_02050 [Patescibacteria group bacterium]
MFFEDQEAYVVAFDQLKLSVLTGIALSLKNGLQRELSERFPRLLSPEERKGLTITECVQYTYWTAPIWIKEEGTPEMKDSDILEKHRIAIFFKTPLPVCRINEENYIRYLQFQRTCRELILNCYFQDAEFIYIDINVDKGYIIVFDDIERSAEVIQYLLKELNQPCLDLLKLSKKCGINVGTGISTIRNMFEDMGSDERLFQGCLRYVTDGKRIIAIVSWDPNVYYGD